MRKIQSRVRGWLGYLLLIGISSVLFAQPIRIRTDAASVGRMDIVVYPFTSTTSDAYSADLANVLYDVVKNDLAYSGYFNVLEPGDLPPDTVVQVRRVGSSYDTLRTFSGSSAARIQGTVAAGWDRMTSSMKIFFPPKIVAEYEQDFNFSSDGARDAGHEIASWITQMLTGETGAYASKIAFVVKSAGTKEIWVMDWDGANPHVLTRDNSTNMSPTWSADGKSLYYTSFKSGNADIYRLDLASGRSAPFAATPRLDSAPCVSPDGQWVAFSSSEDGNSEIYRMRPDGSDKAQLTVSYGIDTSPSFAPTGNELVFTSDRGGSPQIYKMDIDGASVQRLTYSGNYNETARWSPRGDMIAFASREVGFQIFTLSLADGRERRVTDPGSNLDPSWSADGMKLVYASVQGGKGSIWTCNWDGSGARQLTFGLEASQPQWGPALPQLTSEN